MRSDQLVRRRRGGPGPADPRRAAGVRDAGRRPDDHRAASAPATCCSRRPGGDDELLERTATWRPCARRASALLDAEFAERVRPWPQIGQALMRRAGRRTTDVNVLRAITASRGWRCGWTCCCGIWPRAGGASSRRDPPDAAAHPPPARSAGRRRAAVDLACARPGSSHAGLVTGSAGDLHLHGTLEDHLELLRPSAPRTWPRAAAHAPSSVGGDRGTPTPDRGDARRVRPRPGQRAVDHQRPRLRRRLDRDDRGHQPQPRGSAAGLPARGCRR